MRLGICAIALLAGLSACGGTPKPEEDQPPADGAPAATMASLGEERAIVLDSATVARIGLRTVALTRSVRPPELEFAAEVIDDPGAATTVRAGVSGRLTEAEGRRWPQPGEWLETGEAIGVVGDARPIPVPRSGTVVRLAAQPGELVQAGQELVQLVDFRTALVRVVLEQDGAPPPSTLSFATPGAGSRLTGRLQGAAPEADPVTRSPAWLYRVASAGTLRPGVALVAYRADPRAERGGILVPSDAVVQWDALAWAFVERAPGRFVRVRVPSEFAVPGGWLVQHGLTIGDRVVVVGAGQLLSEEFRARISVGQEVGE